MVGILSIVAQTLLLSVLMRTIGNKNTVLLGLGFQLFQLAWYGFGSEPWMMWAAGTVAAMSSITFPAVSALVSHSASPDQQGEEEGLCNGLGPCLYGFIFFLFNVELNDMGPMAGRPTQNTEVHTRINTHTFEEKRWGVFRSWILISCVVFSDVCSPLVLFQTLYQKASICSEVGKDEVFQLY
uniref:Uncharacterized protein n=1 Tax=Seriola lalandi dorsalis TaxID=1841481 RepID=A0A3B4XFI5_SERLL